MAGEERSSPVLFLWFLVKEQSSLNLAFLLFFLLKLKKKKDFLTAQSDTQTMFQYCQNILTSKIVLFS